MPGKDLGTKHTCFKCGTRFYDLKKPAPVCPKCGTDQREGPASKAPPAERRRPAPKPPPEPEVAVSEDLEEEGEEVVDEDEETPPDDEG
ncbi:MAG TPA: FYDLN acid domain-containing protein [Anaeromyxobacteraceae bacterium]|nr:FYDLN acid domain-containing protein [Anaeromyxobacteraceae bacterium]